MEKQKKPALRFKGFQDDWEQRKLGEITNRVTRKNDKLESTLPLTISAQYGLIDQNEFFDKRIASKDISGYFLIYNGEFAYNKSTSVDAPWGAIKRLDRYENGVLSTLYIVFQITGTVNSNYLVSYYSTDLWHKEIQAIAAEGARNHGLLNIAPADFFNTVLTIPKTIDEQEKIGSYFQNLEKVITLHQRKLLKLQNLKKAMLEKMFPKNGAKVPEIRFAGFTEDWEQRKYSNVINLISGQDFEPSQYNENKEGIPYLTGASCIENGHTVAVRWTQTPRCIAEKGDTVLVCKGSGYGTIAVVDQEKAHIARQFMAVKAIDGEIDKAFNYYLLYSVIESIKKDARGLIAGIARDAVLNQPVLIPNIDEQVKIAHSLTNLDNLITLHQRKLEKLQNLKKAMLEKMFI